MADNTSDDDLFKTYMKGVRPLAQDQHMVTPPPKKFKKISRPLDINPSPKYEFIYDPLLTNQDHWLTGEETAHFRRDGISESTLKSLKAGKFSWGARLDLHHYTSSDAIHAIDAFLTDALSKNIRCVLIIHGKGVRTPHQKPIIKNILLNHLRDNAHVLAYHSARPSDGGAGAVYVYLKKER